MVDIQQIVDLWLSGVDSVKHFVPPDHWPSPAAVGMMAVVAGAVAAFWGARLLRLVYIFGFMAGGAALGIQAARYFEIEDLVGLVLGTGLLGLFGHLFYRWWVGMTAGLFAVVMIAALGGPQFLPVIEREWQAFTDQRLGTADGEYPLPDPQESGSLVGPGIGPYLNDLWSYCNREHTALTSKTLLIVGLVWLVGLFIGVAMPRITSIVGTSFIGVLGLAMGSAVLLSSYVPDFWSLVLRESLWFLGITAVLLLASLTFQARPRPKPAAIPTTATAA